MNRKEKVCDKVSSLARNNEDSKQFVMPSSAILTTQILNMELMNVENKVTQLNCCKKDLDLLKNKFRESQHKRKREASQIMNKGFREINGSQNSLDLHFKNKPQIVPEQEPSIEEKVPATFQKLGGKNDDAQKFQVYLSAECNICSRVENICDKNQGINTEAMKPLSIKPKEYASIFKTKNVN
ncbi:unnamed protein product [Moneuplotes crassus]|uniref:Uncharacterized protein n=1 Tax=Euplotes crassus TaxID=5936 RepID=A0AAD1X8W4_EUPCR|nr:unnamed protein product [Moneuplotes crassus]